jgi:hypothetical protein
VSAGPEASGGGRSCSMLLQASAGGPGAGSGGGCGCDLVGDVVGAIRAAANVDELWRRGKEKERRASASALGLGVRGCERAR